MKKILGTSLLVVSSGLAVGGMVTTKPFDDFLPTLQGTKMHKHMVAHFGDLAGGAIDTTEYSISCALKRAPLTTDVEYLSIPWATLVFAKVFKYHATYKKMMATIRGEIKKREIADKPIFTVCGTSALRKDMLQIAKELGVTHFFSTQVHTAGVSLDGMKILPLVFPSWNGVSSAGSKDILYSFVGYATHKLRLKLFDLPPRSDVVMIQRDTYYGYQLDRARKLREIAEYKNIASRSRFGLCPRGSYPNTIRLSELMQAGAIPVVIADDLLLPDGFNWADCFVWVKERDIDHVDSIIRSITPEREEEMRSKCLRFYNLLETDPAFSIRYFFDGVELNSESSRVY